MSALKIIVTVIYCIVAIAFTASVLMQEENPQVWAQLAVWLRATGARIRSFHGGKVERFTLIGAIIFFVGAILLNMNFFKLLYQQKKRLSQFAAAVLCLL